MSKPHLTRGRTSTIGDNLGPDDRYWVGSQDEKDFDRQIDNAYGPAFALRRILKPIIERHAVNGLMAEGRMNAALLALVGESPKMGSGERLRDEAMLFALGQRYHREFESNKPDAIKIGKIIREMCVESRDKFNEENPDKQHSIVKSLREKFNKNKDRYCAVGSTFSDETIEERNRDIRKIVAILKRLDLA